VAYAAPAVIACLLLELHLRYSNRETRQRLGRVAPALPVLGAAAVALYPWRSSAWFERTPEPISTGCGRHPAPGPGPGTATVTSIERPEPVSEHAPAVSVHDPAVTLGPPQDADLRTDADHLAGLPTDAERIRWAQDQLDTEDTGIIVRHLAERSHLVTSENVRAVLRRGRQRPNNRVAQLGHRPMQASNGAGEQQSRGVAEHAST